MSDEIELETIIEDSRENDFNETSASNDLSSEPQRKRTKHTNWYYVKPQKNRLYSKIIKTKSVENVIQTWVESYVINRERAIMKLLQLFIDLCNFQNFRIDDFLDCNEIDEIVEYMENLPDSDFVKTEYRYLIKYRSKELVNHQKKISSFIITLIRECEAKRITYDNYMMNFCVKLLKLLSDSNFRGIKHTGVYIALKFITGLVLKIRDIYNEAIGIKREIRDLKNKSGDDGDNDTTEMENLEIQLISIEDNYKKLLKPMHYLYENVFKKNWNLSDKQLYVMRCDCINEARQWIKYFPEKFLSHDLIQIILDAVTDGHKSVRLMCIQLFMNIIDNISYKEKIKPMIKKIIVVVCGRVLDVDINVSVYAVDLICLIDRTYRTLSSDLQRRIMLKIYCPYYNLACAAGRYLSQKIITLSSNYDEMLKKLIKYQALCEAEHSNIASLRPLLVEATIDSLPALSSINSYINLFQDNELEDTEKDILCDVLYYYLEILSEGKSYWNHKTKRKIDYGKIQGIMKEIFKNMDYFTTCYPKNNLSKMLKLFVKITNDFEKYLSSLNRTDN